MNNKKMNIDELLWEMRAFAGEHHIPISTSESIETIDSIIEASKPKYCLEIGTCIGYATIAIARKIQNRWGHIVSFEISIPSFWLAQSYRNRSHLSNIDLVFQDILLSSPDEIIGLIKDNNDQVSPPLYYDFIYIDGQKSKYLDFLLHVLPLIHDESTILIDDVLLFPSKTQTLRERIERHQIDYTLIRHQDNDAMMQITWKALKKFI